MKEKNDELESILAEVEKAEAEELVAKAAFEEARNVEKAAEIQLYETRNLDAACALSDARKEHEKASKLWNQKSQSLYGSQKKLDAFLQEHCGDKYRSPDKENE